MTQKYQINNSNISPIKHDYAIKIPKGISEDVVRRISELKKEPTWMLDYRLNAYRIFKDKSMPNWGGDLAKIDFKNIHYYLNPTEKKARSWDEVPENIKNTYDKLGIPEAEQKVLSGVTAQLESEVIYEGLKKELKEKGILFMDTNSALQKHPELFEEYFGTLIPPENNKFAALNCATWSGGSFIYIPKGVTVDLPLQTYFLINAQNVGQFERTLIIADEGSQVHYIEGCTAPTYSSSSLHAAVVEVFVKKNARVRYTTVQNWSKSVYNLTTKRSKVEENGVTEWVDANIGSQITMKYPACILAGENARGEVLSLAYANEGQHQDTGAKMIHLAPNTSSRIISKSISKDGGRCSYRGLVSISKKAKNCSTHVTCDAMILDDQSRSDTYPVMKIDGENANVQHEATVSKISEEKLYYLTSRGMEAKAAESLLVNGFIEPIVKEIPLEYAVEMNRLINVEMEETVG